MPTILGLRRLSREEQAKGDRTSLDDQRKAIEARAAALGGAVANWYDDVGVSGAAEVSDRPAFAAMLRYCEANPQTATSPGYVLVLNDSRWGRWRDPEEAAHWRWHLRRQGWQVQTCENHVDGAVAPIMRAVSAVEASEYVKNLSKNVKRGMAGTVRAGFYHREAPFGYRRQEVGTGRVLEPGKRKTPGERVKLTPYEPEAKHVRTAYEMFAAGKSCGQVALYLRKHAPVRTWTAGTVRRLLTSDVYLGIVRGGVRPDSSKFGPTEPYSCEDAHEALVSRELFARVQRTMPENRASGKRMAARYLLSGVLKCAGCGLAYKGGGTGSGSPTARFYKLVGCACAEGPRNPCVSLAKVDMAVVDTVADVLADPSTQEALSEAFERLLRDDEGTDRTRGLRAERTRLLAKRDRLTAAIADGTLTSAEARSQLEAVRAELASVEDRAKRTKLAGDRRKLLIANRRILTAVTLELYAFLSMLESVQVRAVLLSFIESATFNKRTREIGIAVRPLPEGFPADLIRLAREMLLGEVGAADLETFGTSAVR